MANLINFFETFMSKNSIFKNKQVLQSSYIPENILHREEQLNQIASILAPALREDRPSNIFIYGKTGTGKTLSVKYTTKQLSRVADAREVPLKMCYINCKLKKVADTEYRLIATLSGLFRKKVPPTGLPTDEVYKIFFSAIDAEKSIIVIILDEIDQLVSKTGDDVLYNLTRINSELKNSQISIIGISNDLTFTDNLDPRVKSSLSEEEVIFPPYNAIQIQQILRERGRKAFKKGTIAAGVIEKCAAIAAREHGDARRALELLRVAGELADRSNSKKVMLKHLDEAEDKIERDKILEVVKSQPKQYQAIMYTLLIIKPDKKKRFFTGDVYSKYMDICSSLNLRPLTQRRVSDVLAEFDMLGLIRARVISKGRYGRTREMSMNIPDFLIPKVKLILKNSLNI